MLLRRGPRCTKRKETKATSFLGPVNRCAGRHHTRSEVTASHVLASGKLSGHFERRSKDARRVQKFANDCVDKFFHSPMNSDEINISHSPRISLSRLMPLPDFSRHFPVLSLTRSSRNLFPERREVMSVAALILLSLSSAIFALAAYLWYLTPDPKDLAEEVLCQTKPRAKTTTLSGNNFAGKPQPNMTHINCLS